MEGHFPGQSPPLPCPLSLPYLHGSWASAKTNWSPLLKQEHLEETSDPLFVFNGYKKTIQVCQGKLVALTTGQDSE